MSLSVCGCAKFSFRKNETKFGLEHLVVGSGCELYVNSLARGRAFYFNTRVLLTNWNEKNLTRARPGPTKNARREVAPLPPEGRGLWWSRRARTKALGPLPPLMLYTIPRSHTHTHNSPSLVLTEELIHSRWHKNHIHVINTQIDDTRDKFPLFLDPRCRHPRFTMASRKCCPNFFLFFPYSIGARIHNGGQAWLGAEAEEAHSCD